MFFRKNEINPYSVTDQVTFRNVDKTILLNVRAYANVLVVDLKKANERLAGLKDDTPEEDRKEAARMFAASLFGTEQADKLMAFYDGDALAVITCCGMYFRSRLAKKITKAQKK